MSTVQSDPRNSSSCGQHDGVLQHQSCSISLDELPQFTDANHLERRHSVLEAGLPHSDVHIPVNDWISSSTFTQSERKPAYMLTPQASRPALSASSSPARKFSRFSTQNFSELFGNMLPEPANDQNRAANNQASLYDKFRTRSARYDRQSSTLRRSSAPDREDVAKTSHADDEGEDDDPSMIKPSRYFNALGGPELDEIRDHEVLILPKDELWPFLLRFPLNCFGVCLGLGSQSILWKRLHKSPELSFINIPEEVNIFLWSIALLAYVCIALTYMCKVLVYFEAVRREYFHPVRVNFFFAPWIAAMFLAIGIPPSIAHTVHPVVFCCLMSPVFILELKLYGQWLSGGKRRLSKVANPSTHLSIVGNFVGSLLAAIVKWKEPAIFFWSVGLAHYLVLFVTLYQRLPTNEKLPKDLHPVFFLFVAAPSTASVAWSYIVGEFDYVSRVVFFIALFLYTSLAVRINFFRGIRFTLSWWAYTFPMTGAAIAAIEYAHAAPSWITRVLAIVLSLTASITVFGLFCTTLLHIFVWRTIFQNDNAIAITAKGVKHYSLHKIATMAPSNLELENEPLHKIVLNHLHHLLGHHESSLKRGICHQQHESNTSGQAVSISASDRSLLDDDDLHSGARLHPRIAPEFTILRMDND